tara:strand:+ start:2784 stop:3662 length:879 start_codon:yes stop_codon:yes gene_type:complete
MKGYLYILQRNPPTYIEWGGKLCEVFKLGKTIHIDKRTMQNNKGYRTGQDPAKWELFMYVMVRENYTHAENKLKKLLAIYKYGLPDSSAQEMLAIPREKNKWETLGITLWIVMGKPDYSEFKRAAYFPRESHLWQGIGNSYLGRNIYLYSPQNNGLMKLITGTVNLFKDDKFICTDEEGDSCEYTLSEVEEMLDKPILDWNKLNIIQINNEYNIRELAYMWKLIGPHSLTRWFKLFKGIDYLDKIGRDVNGSWTEFKKGTWLPCPRDKNDKLNDYYVENCHRESKKNNKLIK